MQCRVCDSRRLDLAIDLGEQPWANHFLKKEEVGKEPHYPLRVLFCRDCTTTQLDYTVPKEVMFADHTYLSGITKSLSEHFKTVATEVDATFFKEMKSKRALDIGSNDGTQLKHFKELGYDVVGVESSKTTAAIANAEGITTVNAFFNEETAGTLGEKFDIINASGVFFHLEELHSVTRAVKNSLKDDGVFVVQFLYMKSIVENCAFDQIYHEHLLYYTVQTLEVLLKRHGLSLFDATLSPIHGGSIIAYATHAGKKPGTARIQKFRDEEVRTKINEIGTYFEFAKRIAVMKEDNLRFLQQKKKEGKKIFGFGAPVKGNTLLNTFGITSNVIDCLVEKNALRKGLVAPGSHIPIAIESELTEIPDLYYVLAWNFKKEILANSKALLDKGVEFFFPVNPSEVGIR